MPVAKCVKAGLIRPLIELGEEEEEVLNETGLAGSLLRSLAAASVLLVFSGEGEEETAGKHLAHQLTKLMDCKEFGAASQ